MSSKDDITNKRFNKLLAVEISFFDGHKQYSRAYWKCICDCGNVVNVRRDHLTRGKTQSCGCLRKDKRGHRTETGHTSLVKVYGNYKHSARKRNKQFDLTFDQFKNLSEQDCFYCGASPSGFSFMKNANGGIYYNGLDRADSSKGYTLDNVVPCCGICNRAKIDMEQSEFLRWIQRLQNRSVEVKNAHR